MRCRWGRFANYIVVNGTNQRRGDSKIFVVASVRNLSFVQTLYLGERGGRHDAYLSVVDAARACVSLERQFEMENNMPAFLIPVLIGIPVIVGGGYLIVKVLH
jgi:hypothetical protein